MENDQLEVHDDLDSKREKAPDRELDARLVDPPSDEATLLPADGIAAASEPPEHGVDVDADNAGVEVREAINEYNSAVDYISDLIDQLRGSHASAEARDLDQQAEYAKSDLASRATQIVEDPAAKQSLAQQLLGEVQSDREFPPSEGLLGKDPTASNDEAKPENQTDASELETDKEQEDDADEFSSEDGYAYRRSVLHNLREAAYLATCTSLELNDCAVYARRAYYTSFFGCATALFSTIYVLMSPNPGSFGFAASLGAFSIAFGLAIGYFVSFRGLVRKAAHVRTARSQANSSLLRMP